MTKVLVIKDNDIINKVSIEGHSQYDIKGKDIVCAGISSIIFGTLNTINEFKLDNNIIIKDSLIEINVNDNHDFQVIIKMMLIQLKTIEEKYSNYLKITYQ